MRQCVLKCNISELWFVSEIGSSGSSVFAPPNTLETKYQHYPNIP